MKHRVLRLLLELLPSLVVGFWIGRRQPLIGQRIAAPLVRFGVPISVMGLLLKGGLSLQMLEAAGLAVAAIGLMQTLIWSAPLLQKPLHHRSNKLGCCVGNTAYVGIPVALALLPAEALPISIGYDLGATLLTWSIGPLLLAQPGEHNNRPINDLVNSLSSSPAMKGLLGALVVVATPWASEVASMLWLPSRIVIVLALTVVGMRLGSVWSEGSDQQPPTSTGITTATLIKLVGFPVVMFVLTSALNLKPVMVQALTLQAAAPTAISILLIAEAVRHDQSVAASLVLRTTILAAVSTPIWGWILTNLV